MKIQHIIENATSQSELAKLAHDAYVQATRKGNGPMAAHYLQQYERHKKLAAIEKKKAAKDVAEGSDFDSAAFDRHMDKLRAQKELEKTDPLRALVNKMHSDERSADSRKRPEQDDRKITDPFHPSQSVNIGEQGVSEEKQRLDPSCWAGYKKSGTKIKGDTRVNNCVKEELEETYDGDEFFEAYGELWYNEDQQLDEADYHGRSVPLGKPMQGDVKKFKVYVKDPSTGNIKKVNFGDPDMKIRKSNPAARRSFRARHNCDNPGPRTMARYWSCRKW